MGAQMVAAASGVVGIVVLIAFFAIYFVLWVYVRPWMARSLTRKNRKKGRHKASGG